MERAGSHSFLGKLSLNNNRGNNRRRGRGNNRQQGGQPLNRIDSRARGNAPQLLEKYKKMAHDAHLNGDRVQEEYYLQFADHYFRVLADQKQRQDEARQQRRNDRSQDQDDADNEDNDENSRYASRHSGGERNRRDNSEDEDARQGSADSDDSDDSDSDNPFIRDNRRTRQSKPRHRPRPDDDNSDDNDEQGTDSRPGLDPSALPPAISAGGETDAEEAETKPRRRTRRAAPPAEDGGDSVEAVN